MLTFLTPGDGPLRILINEDELEMVGLATLTTRRCTRPVMHPSIS